MLLNEQAKNGHFSTVFFQVASQWIMQTITYYNAFKHKLDNISTGQGLTLVNSRASIITINTLINHRMTSL